MLKAATHVPEPVAIVAYHTMAICTSVEPKRVMLWLTRNRAARRLTFRFNAPTP